jgi:putative transposase
MLRDSVRRVKRLYPFHIDAWVVLPDHLHCVMTLPPDTDDFPMRWRLIKLLFSKGLPRTERLSATRRKRSERGIWQRRYWEHTITTELDYSKHIDYVHVNPLKHGYVTRVQNWPYSTFHRYVRDGILPTDWVGEVGDKSNDFGERKESIYLNRLWVDISDENTASSKSANITSIDLL